MKKCISFLLLLIPLLIFAQIDTTKVELPYKNDKIFFETIVQVPAITQAVIYTASKKWIAESFQSGKSVIQTEDKEAGQIVGRAYTTVHAPGGGIYFGLITLQFNIQIDCKNEKYRIRFYDIKKSDAAISLFGYTSTESNIPLEEWDKLQKSNNNQKRVEKWAALTSSINKHYAKLIDDFNSRIVESKEDTF
jgi:hypothetical protein